MSQQPEPVVTQFLSQKSGIFGILTALLVACGTVRAVDPPAAESVLTVGRIFGAREFDTDPLPARRWSKRAAAYFTREKPAAGTGSELVRTDPATGKKEVVVPAAAFVPEGAKEPLAVEAYEFSADESRLLVYTNSQRVWRRNTRGDYWLLDVAARKLRKLGGDAAPASLMFATPSPDGTRVAFVRENNLYVQDLDSLKSTKNNYLPHVGKTLSTRGTLVALPPSQGAATPWNSQSLTTTPTSRGKGNANSHQSIGRRGRVL